MAKVYNTPSDVTADDDLVNVDSPDGVAVSLTPAAALKTITRIDEAALEALISKHSDATRSKARDIPPENGKRASIDELTGEVHGSGVGAGGGSSGEDFDSDAASGDGAAGAVGSGAPVRSRLHLRS